MLFLLAAMAAEAPPPANGYVPPKVSAPAPRFPPVEAGAAFAQCRDCPEMVVIPPGQFVMGSSQQERRALGVLTMFDKME